MVRLSNIPANVGGTPFGGGSGASNVIQNITHSSAGALSINPTLGTEVRVTATANITGITWLADGSNNTILLNIYVPSSHTSTISFDLSTSFSTKIGDDLSQAITLNPGAEELYVAYGRVNWTATKPYLMSRNPVSGGALPGVEFLRGNGVGSATGGTAYTHSLAGLQANDLAVVFVGDYSTSNIVAPTISGATFTQMWLLNEVNIGHGAWYRKLTSADITAGSINVSGASTTAIFARSSGGLYTVTPSGSSTTVAAATSLTPPSFAAATANALLLGNLVVQFERTVSNGTNLTLGASTANGTNKRTPVTYYYELATAATHSPSGSFTWSSSSDALYRSVRVEVG